MRGPNTDSPQFPIISMDNAPLDEQESLDRLLGLEFTPDLKWNNYFSCKGRFQDDWIFLPLPKVSYSKGNNLPLQKPSST